MKNNAAKLSNSNTGAFAIPLKLEEAVIENGSTVDTTETEKRMLLFRLSDAASRIRDEANLIRRTAFTDSSARLLRILGEAVEEQRGALADFAGGAEK